MYTLWYIHDEDDNVQVIYSGVQMCVCTTDKTSECTVCVLVYEQ